MVNLTIDGLKVSVPEGTTIMQAAATVGIDIPRLCFLKDINEISACKVCVVEIQGQNRVVTSCTTPVQEGLVVYTNSPKARSVRRTNVELILSQHDCLCATCVRSGNCSLQKLSNDLRPNLRQSAGFAYLGRPKHRLPYHCGCGWQHVH